MAGLVNWQWLKLASTEKANAEAVNQLFGPSADPNRISTQECSRSSASGQTFLRSTLSQTCKVGPYRKRDVTHRKGQLKMACEGGTYIM